jgi:hypothetical protein
MQWPQEKLCIANGSAYVGLLYSKQKDVHIAITFDHATDAEKWWERQAGFCRVWKKTKSGYDIFCSK